MLESVRDHNVTAVRSCNSAGKSWGAGRVAIWFLACHYPSIVITTAPTDRQVQNFWKEIRLAHAKANPPIGGRLLTQQLTLADNWFAWGFTARERDKSRFSGFHSENILVIVDEAAGVSGDIYEQIDGLLSSGARRRLLMLGNPTDHSGEFASSFKRPSVSKIAISAFDTPNFTEFGITLEDIRDGTWSEKIGDAELPTPHLIVPDEVRGKWEKWGEGSPMFQSRVLGQFPDQGEDTLIPLAWIERAQHRTLEPGEPVELGCDVARFGSDESVIGVRRGKVYRRVTGLHSRDTMEVSGRIVQAMVASGASIAKVDEIGVGGGVVDRLAELGRPVVGVNASHAALDSERFANARAEWFWNIREMLEHDELDLDEHDEELASQLASIKWKPDSRGRVRLEPKDETAKRINRSPDDADTMAHTFAPSRAPVMLS